MMYCPTVPPVTAAQAVQARASAACCCDLKLSDSRRPLRKRVVLWPTVGPRYCVVERLDGPRVRGVTVRSSRYPAASTG